MLCWYWHGCWMLMICLTNLSPVKGYFNQPRDLSLCSFSDDYQLNYSCHNEKDNSGFNTLEVNEHLCGNYDEQSKGIRTSCKNISLLFFNFQTHGLCVASSSKNVATIKQVFIKLPVNGINYQHFLICTNHNNLLHNYTFSCATDVDKITDLSLTISGYDVSIDSIWTTMLKINVTCSNGSVEKHRTWPVLYIIMGAVGGPAVSGAVITMAVVTVVLIKWYNKRQKHTMSRRLYACTLVMNKALGIQPDPVLVDSDATNFSQPQTVDPEQPISTGSNTSVHQQDNSSEDTSISPLPKNNEKYVILPNLCIESWIETSSL